MTHTRQGDVLSRRWLVAFERLYMHLGKTGVAGLLLVSVALFLGFVAARASEESAALKAEIAHLDTAVREAKLSATRPDTPHTDHSNDAWEQNLPTLHDLPRILSALSAAAEKRQIQMEQIEYLNTKPSTRSPGTYSVHFVIRADYPELRRFLARVMNEQPALAMRELVIRRDDPQQTAIEAKVRLAIFYREAP